MKRKTCNENHIIIGEKIENQNKISNEYIFKLKVYLIRYTVIWLHIGFGRFIDRATVLFI